MQIFKAFTFDSAHFLPHVPENHNCRGIHGHTYRAVIHIEGSLDEHSGWVMDFADLKHILSPIIKTLDHKLLNDIPGLDNPTCEKIAIWLWEAIKPQVPQLVRIELHETPTSGAIYEGK